ncbi:MAG: hypothetical protein IIB95_02675 [Candidatus Marinimicrobia bacterium]|nr:hypothetical protein [Candidatus Neomarinimicrobiota bacterium]MCH7762632.1 hypothetical protein [Candidatus Neomarinimicrobiota bacterium]
MKIIPEVVKAQLVSVISDRRFFITGLPDESLGEKIVLLVEGNETKISFDQLGKYEKPKEINFIHKFVETESGKVCRQETINLVFY